MGLTNRSVGRRATEEATLLRRTPNESVIALAGNPNVGKSTLFNALTGMHQHTGNWHGKTVTSAQGHCKSAAFDYLLVDLPGTYSLRARSAEEEVARDFICFEEPDAVIVVCDATCIERNLNLVLQIIESGARVILCLNLMDEAKRKHVRIDRKRLESRLGIPVVTTVARKKKSLNALLDRLDRTVTVPQTANATVIPYPHALESAVAILCAELERHALCGLESRWLSLRLLEGEESLLKSLDGKLGEDFRKSAALTRALDDARALLENNGIDRATLCDLIVSSTVSHAEALCRDTVTYERAQYGGIDRKLDRILTGRVTAYPIMILFLLFLFWLTVTAANTPSAWLSAAFERLLVAASRLLISLDAPPWLHGLLVDGILRVLAWVVSVMLPPMAIFFPLFTLLEDVGFLPRLAYNLDRPFQRCQACGKQALTMWVPNERVRSLRGTRF